MKIEAKKFRIGTLAEKLNVEKYIVRFWEKEFNLKSQRSTGQQRFYTKKDLEKFSMIKELLYEKGFTISGAKKHLKEYAKEVGAQPNGTNQPADIVASQVTTMESNQILSAQRTMDTQIADQMLDLQRKLIKLRELL